MILIWSKYFENKDWNHFAELFQDVSGRINLHQWGFQPWRVSIPKNMWNDSPRLNSSWRAETAHYDESHPPKGCFTPPSQRNPWFFLLGISTYLGHIGTMFHCFVLLCSMLSFTTNRDGHAGTIRSATDRPSRMASYSNYPLVMSK